MIRAFVRGLADRLGAGRHGRRVRVDDDAALRHFIESRSSYVAQTTLYGYLRTRAGMRYPVLFDDDAFVVSINAAKWQLWVDCLSDLAVWTGGLIAHRSGAPDAVVGHLMERATESVLADTGRPAEAGDRFEESVAALRTRLSGCAWRAVPDDETPFSRSPAGLVRWAPVTEHLKELDAEIVRNSVRFCWQEVRRDLRRNLDAQALVAGAAGPVAAAAPERP